MEPCREQLDIASAASVLRLGVLTERQLAKALGSWTIHGSVSLPDHLIQIGLIDAESRQKVVDQASTYLESLRTSGSNGGGSPSESVLTNILDSIDPSGKIAQLMGIRATATVT